MFFIISIMLYFVKNSLKLAQHSRLMLVQNGDNNFSSFLNCACIHRHKNYISHIADDHGNIFIDRPNIEQCFLNFNFDLRLVDNEFFYLKFLTLCFQNKLYFLAWLQSSYQTSYYSGGVQNPLFLSF